MRIPLLPEDKRRLGEFAAAAGTTRAGLVRRMVRELLGEDPLVTRVRGFLAAWVREPGLVPHARAEVRPYGRAVLRPFVVDPAKHLGAPSVDGHERVLVTSRMVADAIEAPVRAVARALRDLSGGHRQVVSVDLGEGGYGLLCWAVPVEVLSEPPKKGCL